MKRLQGKASGMRKGLQGGQPVLPHLIHLPLTTLASGEIPGAHLGCSGLLSDAVRLLPVDSSQTRAEGHGRVTCLLTG